MLIVPALWEWLAAPINSNAAHLGSSPVFWHARAMVLAWGILIPMGALAARYFKITARQRWPHELDNQSWWITHRFTQWTGVLLATLGLWMIWGHAGASSGVAGLHRALGWAVMVLGWTQIVLGYTRGTKGGPTDHTMRGDHYDMTPRRLWFERMHKLFGWASVLLALAVIASGLWIANAPRWMPISLTAWWATLIVLARRWQRMGRCVDTYQAIWGPDGQHPGNQRPVVGWGARRLGEVQQTSTQSAPHAR